MLYSELSLTAQTLYAQLLESALGLEAFRNVSSLSGSFAAKTVKGRTYWYYKYTEPSGKPVQLYIGPDTSEVQRLMSLDLANQAGATDLRDLTRAAAALGCTPVLSPHLKVIRRLSEYGFFRAGGVLIGTHAFLCYGNMLGLKWGDTSRTQDVDFAHAGKSVSLLLPANLKVDTASAIDSLGMGFLPMPNANATFLIPKTPEFRLDFLTTMHRNGLAPFKHPQLNVDLQPMKFMEYSLQDIQQAVVFCDLGAVVVNLPSPERYALHKLLVYGERKGAFAIKSRKDLNQSASLLAYLKTHREEDVTKAAADLWARGKGWQSRFLQGVNALNKAYPTLGAAQWLLP